MTHPARIVLYTNPDGNAATLWINGEPIDYGTDAWHDAVKAVNQATRDDIASNRRKNDAESGGCYRREALAQRLVAWADKRSSKHIYHDNRSQDLYDAADIIRRHNNNRRPLTDDSWQHWTAAEWRHYHTTGNTP